ncbi:MAG: carbohydrate ABC transporter permease [Ruminococcus sp.]|jgi:multiple sugar transport system permease protein|nr:carbohydrate ABC transporter permease [Ruminococcus sp.]
MITKTGSRNASIIFKVIAYTLCVFLTILSIFPFLIMFINATRSSPEIQAHAISLLPSTHLLSNFEHFNGKPFNPMRGFLNSMIISGGSTGLNIYFSTLTAYAIVAYNWKFRNTFFAIIMGVMMIPAQLTSIGFYKFMYQVDLVNNFIPLILPAIAAPATVFFMRQYMMANLPLDLLEAARIDGSKEFWTFNRIVLPIMTPAMATQAIFSFVGSWNSLFLPMILLTEQDLYTMPIMVSLLKGDIYKTEYGSVYLGLSLTVLPLFVVYFLLSKYIIAGVALGGVKG